MNKKKEIDAILALSELEHRKKLIKTIKRPPIKALLFYLLLLLVPIFLSNSGNDSSLMGLQIVVPLLLIISNEMLSSSRRFNALLELQEFDEKTKTRTKT